MVVVEGVLGFDQPEQTSQWGWATCMGPIPMQTAASLPQTEGREETECEEEGQQQKDREGARRGTTEMKKKAHTTGTESWAPKHQRLLRARNEEATQETLQKKCQIMPPVAPSVQCRHDMLRSERNSCKRIKTNIFSNGIAATFLASRVRSEQMTRIQKVVVLSSIERANRRASGCRRQA